MARLVEQRNLSLTPAQWAGLEAAAEQTNSRAERGTAAYQFSWRTLLRRIGEGELLVQELKPYRLPDGLAEAAAAVEQRQREQEHILEQQRRIAEQAKPQRKTPAVKMEQLHMLEMEPA